MRPDHKTLDSSYLPAPPISLPHLTLCLFPFLARSLSLSLSPSLLGLSGLRPYAAATYALERRRGLPSYRLSPFIRHLRPRARHSGTTHIEGYSAYETATLELSRDAERLEGFPHAYHVWNLVSVRGPSTADLHLPARQSALFAPLFRPSSFRPIFAGESKYMCVYAPAE